MALPCCFSHCSCILGLHACPSPWGSSVPPKPPVLSLQICISMPVSRTFCNFPLLSFQPLSLSPVPPSPSSSLSFFSPPSPHKSGYEVLECSSFLQRAGSAETETCQAPGVPGETGVGVRDGVLLWLLSPPLSPANVWLCALGLRPRHCPVAHKDARRGQGLFLWALSPHEPTV